MPEREAGVAVAAVPTVFFFFLVSPPPPPPPRGKGKRPPAKMPFTTVDDAVAGAQGDAAAGAD